MKRGSIQEVIPVILKPSLSEGGGEVCQVIWGRESVLNYSRALRLSYNIIKNYYKNKEGNLMMRGDQRNHARRGNDFAFFLRLCMRTMALCETKCHSPMAGEYF